MTAPAPSTPQLLGACAAGRLRIALTRYPPHLVQPRHAHGHAAASLILAGALHEEWRSGSFSGRALAAVHKPRGAGHETRFGPEGALILSVAAPAGSGEDADPRWTARPATDGATVETLLRALVGGRPTEAEDAAQDFLAGLAPAGTPCGGGGWLIDLFDRLADEPGAAPSVAELARRSGVDPAYAARAFRRRFGLSPLQHRRRARCYRALDLLLGGTAPAEAAAAAGFCDQSHLTRELGARFGLTPGRLARRKVKNLQDRAVLQD